LALELIDLESGVVHDVDRIVARALLGDGAREQRERACAQRLDRDRRVGRAEARDDCGELRFGEPRVVGDRSLCLRLLDEVGIVDRCCRSAGTELERNDRGYEGRGRARD